MRDDLAAYLADVAERAKPATAAFYRARTKWIRETFGDRGWAELTPQLVLAALDRANRWPDGRRKAPDTQRANAIAWEQFQGWAIATGRLAQPITEKLAKPAGRQRDRLPSLDEIGRLLAGAPPDFAAIYQALLLTGARPGELCRATIADYDQAAGIVSLADHKTRAKTGRPRIIPVGDRCRALLQAAIGERTEGPVFLRRCGRAWTTGTLSQAFRRRRDGLGLDRSLVLYSTRHKFATELCHAQGIEAAAAVLGHSGLQTIRRYVHHDTEQLRKYAAGVDPGQLLPGGPDPPPDKEAA
jgi:integrase